MNFTRQRWHISEWVQAKRSEKNISQTPCVRVVRTRDLCTPTNRHVYREQLPGISSAQQQSYILLSQLHFTRFDWHFFDEIFFLAVGMRPHRREIFNVLPAVESNYMQKANNNLCFLPHGFYCLLRTKNQSVNQQVTDNTKCIHSAVWVRLHVYTICAITPITHALSLMCTINTQIIFRRQKKNEE